MIDVGSNSKGTGYKYSDYGKEVYTYDGLNELKSYRGKNEQNATYEYMPNHYRISKTVDGTKHISCGIMIGLYLNLIVN